MKLRDVIVDFKPPIRGRAKSAIRRLIINTLNLPKGTLWGEERMMAEEMDISVLNGVTYEEILEVRQCGEKTTEAVIATLRKYGISIGDSKMHVRPMSDEEIQAMSEWL